MDAIGDGCYEEMIQHMKGRIELLNKETNTWKKKEAICLKKFEKLEPKSEDISLNATDKKRKPRTRPNDVKSRTIKTRPKKKKKSEEKK